jgi:hypothetical protein
MRVEIKNKMSDSVVIDQRICRRLAEQYHAHDPRVIEAANMMDPVQFVRLFISVHGMNPVGQWQTHTYARVNNPQTGKDHFFLIPMAQKKSEGTPNIHVHHDAIWIDDMALRIYLQRIPYTTPFWYFHYNPNHEDRPFESMTLNLSPSCEERCVLCAGAKTGRVNNGMDDTLGAKKMFDTIFTQYPDAVDQLKSLAIVTGCFPHFDAMESHLAGVKKAVHSFCDVREFRVLEHNVVDDKGFDRVVRDLGYDVYVTLECFDQKLRNIALNGKVGRKGRDSREFLAILENYASYLDRHSIDGRFVHVTYLIGLDDLSVTEYLFQAIKSINDQLSSPRIIPWLSIFTAYNNAMRIISHPQFGLGFLFEAMALAERYFDRDVLLNKSGGTNEGYARGLY